MQSAIDWAESANGLRGGDLRNRIDLEKIAVTGWSCGGFTAIGETGRLVTSSAELPRHSTPYRAQLCSIGRLQNGDGFLVNLAVVPDLVPGT
jgi:hypothetical protein